MNRGYCDTCGRLLPKQQKGRPRLRHPECAALAESLDRLDAALADLPEMTADAAALMRRRIIGQSNRLPRQRTKTGAYRRTA